MHVPAYAAPAPGEPLAPTLIERRDPGPHDVLIAIGYAGICHSDIHTVRGDWGPRPYPLVPGHEITGVVTATGSGVTRHRAGDRVGVGCIVDSCRTCADCRAGNEQYCRSGMVGTYGAIGRDGAVTQGGYAGHIVVDEDFVLPLPDGLDPATAAPLLCAGITTYSPLRRWNAGPGTRLAVVGLGGLGHLAVRIGHALGAEVTVLSRSYKKQEDAVRLGADHYHVIDSVERLAGRFDLILNTAGSAVDLDAYLSLVAVDGTLVNVGAPAAPLTLNAFSLIDARRSLAGSLIGGIAETREMLEFCATHRIGADVEIIAADRINEAYERVLSADVRYRFVVDTATLPVEGS
ncbi:NAD(P)-dependent alcohol dehydrogenase [Actinoplanes utahensis]|uniref:alcohol dehydrogenase (NADP(+)) n=1 Tax=Actinoplanes utahensis TaxID=1869 RepID=A0A0A6UK54_ACTUT|nr:NAD(P)-dependent alcohol dehydrogenase [Actinoplanes utahensis]KHD75791.1 alcohol dehydrogenase [Actinoplanes utahensis]GIF32178.1 dehydrogenase [Actinoplanes utahensis]